MGAAELMGVRGCDQPLPAKLHGAREWSQTVVAREQRAGRRQGSLDVSEKVALKVSNFKFPGREITNVWGVRAGE